MVIYSFSNDLITPGHTLVFKWSGHIRLYTRFQKVLHSRFQMVWSHAVTHLFSNGRDTPGYTFVFKRFGHSRLPTHFQLIGTHPVTRSFSIGRDTLGYPLVFKLSRHIWLYTRFQKSWTSDSTFVFKRFGNTRVHTQFNTCFQMVGKHRLNTRF